MRRAALVVLAALTGGCSGEFILTAPDAMGLPEKTAPVVVRLQRREFWFHAPPVRDAAILLRQAGRELKAARTDKAGYAAVGIELPDRPGTYQLQLHHQDARGDTVTGAVAVYVLSADAPIALVDLDSLPAGGHSAGEAAAALLRIQKRAQIVYVTREYADAPSEAHDRLRRGGYPDSAVAPYSGARRWYARWGSRDKAQGGALAMLRQRLPGLRWGVAANDDSAEAFRAAGLTVLGVKDRSARQASHEFFESWAELRLPPDTAAP